MPNMKFHLFFLKTTPVTGSVFAGSPCRGGEGGLAPLDLRRVMPAPPGQGSGSCGILQILLSIAAVRILGIRLKG